MHLISSPQTLPKPIQLLTVGLTFPLKCPRKFWVLVPLKYRWISVHPKYLCVEFKVTSVAVKSLSFREKRIGRTREKRCNFYMNQLAEKFLHSIISASYFLLFNSHIPGALAPQKWAQRLWIKGVQIPWQLAWVDGWNVSLACQEHRKPFSRAIWLSMVVNSPGLYFSTIMG